MNLGQGIRLIRKKSNLTQMQFSAKIGITQTFLSGIESNKKTPSVDVLNKISKLFKCPLPILLWFTIEEDDIDPGNREYFRLIKPSVDEFISGMTEIDVKKLFKK